ncbi:MAG: DUF3310 domain-containing protein [Bacilli bacterium]
MDDKVTSPSHYTKYNIEVIDAIKGISTQEEFRGYCKGNVIKYMSRWQNKGGIEDLKKAKQYIDFLIESEESRGEDI